MFITFPKKLLIDDKKSMDWLCNLYRLSLYGDGTVVWNLTNIKTFDVALLGLLQLILNSVRKKKKKLLYKIDNKESVIRSNFNLINDLFNKFKAEENNIRPMMFRDKESGKRQRLYNRIDAIGISNDIQVAISELVANAFMHCNIYNNLCSFSSEFKDDKIILGIADLGNTIMKNFDNKKIMFSDETDAIIYSLKKSNTTRKNGTAGGLGFYYLRKVVSQYNGTITIISGYSTVKLSHDYYFESDKSRIDYYEETKLKNKLNGVFVYIVLDLESIKTKELINRTNIDII